jgi:transcriptional regulator with XRE-family HTH domain
LTQQRLAERAGLDQPQLTKIETARRVCNPLAAQRLAEELGVDVAELRVHPHGQETRPAKPRVSHRNLHRAYLGVLLGREVGSAYTAMSEEALEKHCEWLSWEGRVEVASGRRREAQVPRELLGGTALPEEVRPFLEEALGTYPDRDIRLLAAARGRESSEEGREGLTQAMREFL